MVAALTRSLGPAHLALVGSVKKVTHVEGCFGRHLLREDPASPLLQFGYGGRAPRRPDGPGLGVTIDDRLLRRFARATVAIPG